MKTFCESSKLFYKNKFLSIAYCLLFLAVNYWFASSLTGLMTYEQNALIFLGETLMVSIFCAVFFMFISYEFFVKAKSSGIEECLAAAGKGRIKLLLSQFALIVILIGIIAVTAVIYNLAYPKTDIHCGEYIAHMVSSIFVYLFMVPLAGALIGMSVSLLSKRLHSYLIMIAFALLSSPLGGLIAFTVVDAAGAKYDFAPVFDIFNMYPVDLDFTPNYSFGMSLLPYKIEGIMFWIFVSLAVVLFKTAKKSQLALRITALLCAAAGVINFAAFYSPSSKIDKSYRADATLFGDSFYYDELYKNGYPEEEEGNFNVLSYNLSIEAKNQLYAEAKVKPDKGDLPVYKFTLSHSYKIKDITNQDNEPLKFSREADRIEIYSEKPLSEINFTYKGYNPRFFSNTQGIYLPGYFAYYPIPGFKNLYTSDIQGHKVNTLPYDTEFNVTVKSRKEVFTNLDSDGKGGFSGKTNGLTVMSGFLKTTVVNGIEVIYPYFNTSEYRESALQKDMDNFMKVKGDDNVKKILIAPNLNQSGDSIAIFSDYITAEQVSSLETMYEEFKIPQFKRALYIVQHFYTEDREAFDIWLQNEIEYETREEGKYNLYKEKIELLGEEKVKSETTKYLYDNSDKRTITEFLKELG